MTETNIKSFSDALKGSKFVIKTEEKVGVLIVYTKFLLKATDDYVTLYIVKHGDKFFLTDLKSLSDYYENTLEEEIELFGEIVKKTTLQYVDYELFGEITPQNANERFMEFLKVLKIADVI